MTALRTAPLSPLRWAAVIPAALLAFVAVQVLLMSVAGLTIPHLYVTGPDWVTWAVKSVASVFMGAAFVGTAAWVAPEGRRGVAIAAVAVVVVWAASLFSGGPDVWGAIMGSAGVTGALATLALVWRSAA